MTSLMTPITCGDCGADNVWVGKLASSMSCPSCGSDNLGLTGVDQPKTAAGATARHWQKGYQDALAGKPKVSSPQWDEDQQSDYAEGYKAGKAVPGSSNHVGPNADPSKKNAARGGLSAEAMARLAAPKGYGTGWGKPHPDPLKGWASEYEGPTPQTFPRQAPVADSTTCPVCKGSGYDLVDKTRCRECGGTGVITHPTDRPQTLDYDATTQAEPAGGAGWRGASRGLSAEAQSRLAARPNTKDPYGPEHQLQHTDPGYGTRSAPEGAFNPDDTSTFFPKAPNRSPNLKNWTPGKPATGPYVMNEAACPACGHAPTELRPDKNEDSWWVCPHCGPLHNIDANIGTDRDVDPYRPPAGFQPNRSMKTGGFVTRAFSGPKTGRLLRVLATIHEANDLGEREALEIARKTLAQYGEGR